MDNKDYFKNVTEEELNKGFENLDGYANRFLTKPFIEFISEYIIFDDVKVILDIGSRDLCQSLEFSRWFPNAKIYAFEPVPTNIVMCRKNLSLSNNVQLIEKAVSNFNGHTIFNEVTNGNIGASSLYKVNESPRSRGWQQREIQVDVIRIDDWADNNLIPKIDLVWADVQGAEIPVFEGFGDRLYEVDVIHTEVEVKKLYHGANLKEDLDAFLDKQFKFIHGVTERSGNEMDAIYLNRRFDE